MDTKKIALAIASTGITAASIAAAVFLWNQPSPNDQAQTAQEGALTGSPKQPATEATVEKNTGAIVTSSAGRSEEQPAAATTEKEPKSAVHVSLPDPNDAPSDKSIEKFDSDADEEEDTDDGITIETEPDDE